MQKVAPNTIRKIITYRKNLIKRATKYQKQVAHTDFTSLQNIALDEYLRKRGY